MTEVVDTNPIVEVPAAASDDDDVSVKTEVAAPPAEVAPGEPKEEEKADAFLAAIMNFWAMLTGKVKEIDENAGISTKVAKFDEDYHVSEAWNNAVKKAGEMTESVSAKLPGFTKDGEKEQEKEWVEVDEKEQQ